MMSNFKIYKTSLDATRLDAKKLGVSFSQVWAMQSRSGGYDAAITAQICGNETSWEEGGRKIIFIRSTETVNSLLKMKLKFREISAIPLPFPVFTVAVPKNSGLPPALVRYRNSWQEQINEQNVFLDKHGMEKHGMEKAEPPTPENHYPPELKITFPCDEKQLVRAHVPITSHFLEQVLSAKTITASTFDRTDMPTAMHDLTTEERLVALKLVRMVAVLSIYNHVTQNEFLIPGVPPMVKHKEFGLAHKNSKPRSFSLDIPTKSATADHIRSGHYRQLWDERFYQGEYAKLERGARWVYVKETLVGKAVPFTQLSSGRRRL